MHVPTSRQLVAQTAVAFLTFLGTFSIAFPERGWMRNAPAAAAATVALLGLALYNRRKRRQAAGPTG